MPQATVKVQFVNQPKPGKRTGSIKTDQGYFGVFPDKLALFQPGCTYEIEYAETQWGNTFRRIISEGGRPNGGYAGYAAKSSAAKELMPDAQMIMFVTGVVGRTMQSGKFDIKDIVGLTFAARHAFETVMMGLPEIPPHEPDAPRRERDLDDEIPF